MTTKGFIVLFFIVVAVMLFGGVGFNIINSTKYDWLALGLASQAAAVIVNWFMPGGLTA